MDVETGQAIITVGRKDDEIRVALRVRDPGKRNWVRIGSRRFSTDNASAARGWVADKKRYYEKRDYNVKVTGRKL